MIGLPQRAQRAQRACIAVAAAAGAAVVAAAAGHAPPAEAALPGEWSAPAWPIEGDVGEPAVAFDTAGAAHLAWTQAGEDRDGRPTTFVGYARREGGAWTAAERLPCAPPEAAEAVACSEPALAVDAAGRLHIVYVAVRAHGADIVQRERPAGSRQRWSAGVRVSDGGDHVRRGAPAVVADHIGHLHVAWADGLDGRSEVRYRQRLADGSWRDASVINEPAAGSQAAPSLVVATDGTVHAAWRDDRDGLPAIWTSMLPERSFVWWPDARISAPAAAATGRPALAAGALGDVAAVWTRSDGEGTTTLRGARRGPAGPYWDPSRAIAVDARGALGDVALAPRPDGAFTLAWTEARPGGVRRLYTALWRGADAVEAEPRLDGTVRSPRAAAPALALGPGGHALAAWEQPRDGPPHATLALAEVVFALPERPWRTVEGILTFAPDLFGCQRDGYRLVDCDGDVVATVVADGAELTRLQGAYVVAEGWWVDERACPRLDVQRVAARTPPCRRSDAAVFGRLVRDGRPVAGARVHVGQASVVTGRSGRFGLVGLPAATAVVSASAPCALDLAVGAIAFQSGQRLDLGQAELVTGDVIADCVVDVRDLARVARDVRGDLATAHACSDVNEDGTVNVADLEAVRRNLGRRCPQPWRPEDAPPANPGASP